MRAFKAAHRMFSRKIKFWIYDQSSQIVYLLMFSSSREWHWFKEIKFLNLKFGIDFIFVKACGEQFTCFWSLKFYPKYIFIFCLGQPASTTVVVSSVATSTTTAQGVSGVSPPKKSRIPPDPNRVPKYHDERLPAGKIFFFYLFLFVWAKHSMALIFNDFSRELWTIHIFRQQRTGWVGLGNV